MISRNHHTIARTVGADHEPVRGEHWETRAACLGMDTELWFPPGNPGLTDHAWDAPRAVCATCPVQLDCYAEAVRTRDFWGMRGGETPDQLWASIPRRRGGVA